MQSKNKFTLFVQPFLFNISQEQVKTFQGKAFRVLGSIFMGKNDNYDE